MNRKLTLGSLFDGSGGFPLGAVLNGITPVWASEIEPFPIRVTTKRFPKMKHYGDISAMNGAGIEPVDIISFGSPCTDMSVAGKRTGLDGKQSVLFYEAIRIIKEMRCATDGNYPRFILWENVPGAFSSNKGEDFRAVLEAIIQIIEPAAEVSSPENGRWPYADLLLGNGWSLAYRTLDAQYFGVAHRRRRIYLVADFGSEHAGEILFECKGLSRDFTSSRNSWQRTPRNVEECTGAPGNELPIFDERDSTVMSFEPGATSRLGGHYQQNLCGTLRADMGDNQSAVAIENHPTDGRCKVSENGLVQTLTSRMGTGGMNVPLVFDTPKTLKIRSGCNGGGKGALVQDDKSATLSCNNDQTVFIPSSQLRSHAFGICSDKSNSMLSHNPLSGVYEAETARTLDANGGNPSCNQGGIAVVSLQGSMIGRKEQNGPQGSGINEDISFSLTAADRHGIAYAMTTGCFAGVSEEKAATLTARDYKDPQIVNQMNYVVRRLTPTECARLQGFPDWWCADLAIEIPTESEIAFWADVWETHRRIMGTSTKPKTRKQLVKWLRNPHSDAAEYKMWGNGICLWCAAFVLRGIVTTVEEDVDSEEN
jgi:DNA (cytosine-5)-methyltransferase 1